MAATKKTAEDEDDKGGGDCYHEEARQVEDLY